jgi:hypothetical protein
MTFHEKSALTMTILLVVAFGWYFSLVLGVVAGSPGREVGYTALMLVAVAILTIAAAVSHVILALLSRSDANAYDERDRSVALRSERVAGYVLAVGVWAGIALAMLQADRFWIAQALIAALVVAEVTDGIVKLVLYRRAT